MPSPLNDARAQAVLDRLHALDRKQLWSIVGHYLPRVAKGWFTRKPADMGSADHPGDDAFLRDKLVAIDRSKGELIYTLCRAANARRVVEVGTSFGVSTIYLAAAIRDNAAVSGEPGVAIGSELEPTKAAKAGDNLAEAGLLDFAEVRVGDALKTLADCGGPVDFLLVDTWIPLARPAIELLAPQLRPGAIVFCDNVEQFSREYKYYTDFVRDPANGFRSMLWPKMGGVELSVKVAA